MFGYAEDTPSKRCGMRSRRRAACPRHCGRLGFATGRRQPSHAPPADREVRHLGRPHGSEVGASPSAAQLRDTASGDPGRGFDFPSRPPEGAPVPRGREAAAMRAVRAGRRMARAADGADPRSHQWRPDRQPDREPPDRLPELRCDSRDPLRAQEPCRPRPASRVCICVHRVHSEVSDASILLAAVRNPQRVARPSQSGEKSPRPSYRAAAVRPPGDELRGRRPQVRRLGQRRTQVASLLRARAGWAHTGRA